jgi:tetratricopeptide (TPR) repeat protein
MTTSRLPAVTAPAKKIIFSLVPLTILLFLLIVAEIIVRRAVRPPDGELVSVVTYDRQDWYQINRSFLRRYFPFGTPLIPEFKSSLFKKEKPARLFRVVCLGSSSMFGTPYLLTANIPAILRKQLRHRYPDTEIEVINLGASAINSNVVRDLAPRLLPFKPDLVLVYMGHNEFYGPDGVGASWLEKHVGVLTRLKYALGDVRLVQLLRSWLQRRASIHDTRGEANLMRQVSEGSLVPLESPDAMRVFDLFRENLKNIIETFREDQTPVVVSDLSSNLMFPPFVGDSLSVSGKSDPAVDGMKSAYEAGAYDRVLSVVDTSSGPPTASRCYWSGRALAALGRSSAAASMLRRARDLDLLKFRAPTRINEIIWDVCAAEGVTVCSADSVFSAASPGGIPGDELFWEHLHPKAAGYALIADLFVRTAAQRKLTPAEPAASDTGMIPFDPDSLSICWLDRAYADLSIQHLTGRWPFEKYQRSPDVSAGADPQLLQIVRDTYDRKFVVDEGCYRSATYFWARQSFRDAQTTYEALIEEYPYGFYPRYLLGSLLHQTGRTEEAIRQYRRSIESNPAFPRSRLDLGLIEVNAGSYDEGIRQFNEVLSLLGPQGDKELRATAFYGLAAAYANKNDLPRALTYIDQSLALVPDYRDALSLKVMIRRSTGG